MPLHSAFAVLLCVVTSAASARAQRVVLPRGTGGVTPAAGWTVLRTAVMEKPTRATDPQNEAARAFLLGVIAELRDQERLAEHVLFHQSGGAGGHLRLVNAYSADEHATVEDLLAERAVTEIRDTLEKALAVGDTEVEFGGHERTDLFAIGGLCMHFVLQRGAVSQLMDLYVVPAGRHLQYLEATTSAGDVGARSSVEALLRTFDGAREEQDSTLRNMLIGGAAGGLAGILAAVLRRRRLTRRLATESSR